MLISWLETMLRRVSLLMFIAVQVIGAPNLVHSEPIAQIQSIWIADPIFNIGYDPRGVHFELLETSTLLPSCKKFLSDMKPLPKALTLYAKYSSDSTSIYMAGTADNEKFYVIRNGICDAGIPLLSFTNHPQRNPPLASDGPNLPELEMIGLFKDTLARHEKAFGSKKAFLKWLDKTTEIARSSCEGRSEVWCPVTFHTLQPVLQDQLKSYRK